MSGLGSGRGAASPRSELPAVQPARAGRWFAAAAVTVLAYGLSTTGAQAATEPADIVVAGLHLGNADGITVDSASQVDSRLLQATLSTGALAAPTAIRILLPADFDPSGRTRYPVLYLLHGGFGSYTNWTDYGDAERITKPYQVIVVMPDGGPSGEYANWYNFGKFGVPQWETYHVDQLIPWVDSNLPTVAKRTGRAIAGLSMGGGGALQYASRHPDLFAAAGSFSGDVDNMFAGMSPFVEFIGPGANAEEGGPKLPGSVYGNLPAQEIRWRGDDPLDLAANLRDVMVFLAIGNGQSLAPDCVESLMGDDLVEADLYPENAHLHRALDSLGIANVWDSYGSGCHDWPYWQRDLSTFMPLIMNSFAHPEPAPSAFNYRSTEPNYSVYGWAVSISRPAMEWSVLADASAHGFSLSGSGTATVTTGAVFAPGQPVSAMIVDHGGSREVTLLANSSGRLTVTADLGPGNLYNQYSLRAAVSGGTRVYTATVKLAG